MGIDLKHRAYLFSMMENVTNAEIGSARCYLVKWTFSNYIFQLVAYLLAN